MYPKDWYTLYYTNLQFETSPPNLDRYEGPRDVRAFSPNSLESGASCPLGVSPPKRWRVDAPSSPPHLSRNKKGGLLNKSSVEIFDLTLLPKSILPETAQGMIQAIQNGREGGFPFPAW